MRLHLFIARRLLLLIPTMVGVTLITFTLSHAPGSDYAANVYCNPHSPISCPEQVAPIKQYYHLDDPIPVQYVYYLRSLLSGDWGYSRTALIGGASVSDAIVVYFPPTLELAAGATFLATIIGIPMGTISAVKKDKVPDHVTRVVALTGYAIPYFLLALFLQILAMVALPSWPIAGIYDRALMSPAIHSWAFIAYEGGSVFFPQPTHILVIDAALHGDWTVFWDALQHLILPTITLAFGVVGSILRMMRSGMVDSMNQDYVRTAWAKGLPESVVIKRHIRRNALLPTTTSIGLLFAGLLGGVVLVEDVFQWDGIGRWATNSALGIDSGGVMATTLLFALFLVLTNLVVDIVYAYLDPRISL